MHDAYLICPNAHQILRFVSDVDSDPILSQHSPGLRNRFCTRILQDFFDTGLEATYADYKHAPDTFYMDVNLIAHSANLGYIEEDTIRNHILQSFLYNTLYDHQAVALSVLLKIAGATFEAYVDPAVVGRCLELLKNHRLGGRWKVSLAEVSAFSVQGRWNY